MSEREHTRLEKLVKLAAAEGAKAAINEMNQAAIRAQKSRYDRRLNNTRILLENYRMLKQYSESAVYEAEQMAEENAIDLLDLMWEPNKEVLVIDSIKKSVSKTVIILEHVEHMLNIYRIMCEQSGREDEMRHYRVIYSLYIDPMLHTREEIAETEHIDPRTVYKDVNAGIKQLSMLIFGIDGIKNNRKQPGQ